MPTIINVHGKPKVRARVRIQGAPAKTKIFPDAGRTSYREAIKWEEREAQKIRDQLSGETPTEFVTVEIWLEEYLSESQTRHSKKTYNEKRFAFQRLVDHTGPDITVNEISAESAAELIRSVKKQYTGRSANKVRKNLSTAWKWGALTWPEKWPGTANPFAAVKKMPEKQQPRYVPTAEDFWRVYDAADNIQDKVMLQVFIQTAARRNEVFGLTINDLDFDAGMIRLWTNKRAGGREFDWIPMTNTLADELAAWLDYRMQFPGTDPEHVFVCLDTYTFAVKHYGRPFTNRQHLMKRLCKRAGVKPFGFHAIRHLTAVTLYRQGETIATIQAILRHRSATTTAKYLRSLGLDLETSRIALEQIFPKSAQNHNPQKMGHEDGSRSKKGQS